ncbi:hypothetical protein F5890DRAFT_1527291 [Lentinula detonsa]|uniref:Uncharacterized protein n=1 Tax=Lentinula detonsa TaxID=2804962 RepID=A0AA38URQ0_9AGAR|nr:hypothetical protein F5890DRAFT_1527291 [Lentinula detonsa]
MQKTTKSSRRTSVAAFCSFIIIHLVTFMRGVPAISEQMPFLPYRLMGHRHLSWKKNSALYQWQLNAGKAQIITMPLFTEL